MKKLCPQFLSMEARNLNGSDKHWIKCKGCFPGQPSCILEFGCKSEATGFMERYCGNPAYMQRCAIAVAAHKGGVYRG